MNIEKERVIANLKEAISHGADREFLLGIRDIVQKEIRKQRDLQIKAMKQKLDLLIESQEEA